MWRTSLQRWNKWHPANHQERTAFLLNFNDISRYLVSSLKQKLPKGEVSLTQRRGIISLIPKKQSAWRIEKLETLTSIKFWLQNCIKSSCIRAQNCASSLNRQSPGGFWKAGPSQKIPASFTMLSHIPILHSRNVSFCRFWKSVRYHLKVFCSANITLLWLQPFFRQLDF